MSARYGASVVITLMPVASPQARAASFILLTRIE